MSKTATKPVAEDSLPLFEYGEVTPVALDGSVGDLHDEWRRLVRDVGLSPFLFAGELEFTSWPYCQSCYSQ